jgi:hypothetical protein
LTVICAERHLEKAVACVPEWWGVEVAENRNESVAIARQRQPRANPDPDLSAIAQLLWREEALAALELCGQAQGLRSKPRKVLWQTLTETYTASALRALVREQLRQRQGWPAGA